MIDTRIKRMGAMLIGAPYRTILPDPDGVIDEADRAVSAFLYSDFDQGGPVIPPSVKAPQWIVVFLLGR